MSAHSDACEASQILCQHLYDKLREKIPALVRAETKNWCALYELGRNRFVYISHRKTSRRIEVWCLGDVDALQNDTNLEVIPRKKMSAGWEKRFPARFFIDQEADIEAACELLYRVSYRVS